MCFTRRHAGGWLVEQQHRRVARQGDAELELLLVAVAEGACHGIIVTLETDRGEQHRGLLAVKLGRMRPEIAAATAMGEKGRLHVLEDRKPRENVGALKRAAD